MENYWKSGKLTKLIQILHEHQNMEKHENFKIIETIFGCLVRNAVHNVGTMKKEKIYVHEKIHNSAENWIIFQMFSVLFLTIFQKVLYSKMIINI